MKIRAVTPAGVEADAQGTAEAPTSFAARDAAGRAPVLPGSGGVATFERCELVT